VNIRENMSGAQESTSTTFPNGVGSGRIARDRCLRPSRDNTDRPASAVLANPSFGGKVNREDIAYNRSDF
jgi:hypothetical protein